MRSVAELAGKRLRRPMPAKIEHEWPLPDTLMGIEVEVEAYSGVVMPDNLSMWHTKSDGSLQNGREYVLSVPVAGQNLRAAIHELMEGSTFLRSMTGSTHIHMDMLEEEDSTEILRVMVMMIYMLEPMLYAAGDKGREWCGFANKLMTGPDELISSVMNDALSTNEFRQIYSRGTSKFGRYYGMNLAALVDYGSLEFRYFPTATKEEELISWVELVQTFKKAARDVGNLSNLDNIVENERTFNEFLSTYFGKWQHLFGALGSYPLLRNDYRKAHISAKLQKSSGPAEIFRARKIFADSKYKKLLKHVPTDVIFTAYDILTLSDSGRPVPRATMGKVLVFSGRIYFVPMEHSPLNSSYAPDTWADIAYIPSNLLAQDADLVETLSHILHSGEYVINASYAEIVRSLLGEVSLDTLTTAPATEEPIAEDYDDDDYDSEMEDE